MAFKIKDNLDLYGNQLLNFALQSDSGFPQSPQVGHMFNYTGTGVMANHAVMCVDETTKAFKALAFVDEIATNAEFVELKEKVDLLIGDDVDMDGIIESWKEVEAFLAGMKDTENLMDMLNGKLDKSGGTIVGNGAFPFRINYLGSSSYTAIPFYKNGTMWGALGMKNDEPIFINAANDTIHTLIHSGNIGEYKAGSADVIAKTYANERINYARNESKIRLISGYASNSVDLGFPRQYVSGISVISDYVGWQMVCFGSETIPNPYYRSVKDNGVWGSWKQLAFLDDNVASAQALKHSNGTVGAVVNSSGNVTIGASDLAGANYALNVDNLVSIQKTTNPAPHLKIAAVGSSVNYIHMYVDTNNETTGRALVLQNGYGNVGIGCEPKYKLDVEGALGMGGIEILDKKSNALYIGYESAGKSALPTYLWGKGIHFINSGGQPRMIVTDEGYVLIGTSNELKSGAKLQIKGDVYVDGNIIATKEVSAGGAGQEGESGDGGAEVLSQQLASGQSTYTITNTIKRSDIAVSLYEWNANNGSWDMCLADISVKDATITVTFGSATSVNHKLVAVG